MLAKRALLALTLSFAVLLLACGGTSEDAPTPAPAPADSGVATDPLPDPQPASPDLVEPVPAPPPEPETTPGPEEPPPPDPADEPEDPETLEIGDAPPEVDEAAPSEREPDDSSTGDTAQPSPDQSAGDTPPTAPDAATDDVNGAVADPAIDDPPAAPSSGDDGSAALTPLNCVEDLLIHIAHISIQPPEIVFEYTLPQEVWVSGQPWRIDGVFLFNLFQEGVGALQSPVFAAPRSGRFEFNLAALGPEQAYVEVYIDLSDELSDNGVVISHDHDGTLIYCKGVLASR